MTKYPVLVGHLLATLQRAAPWKAWTALAVGPLQMRLGTLKRPGQGCVRSPIARSLKQSKRREREKKKKHGPSLGPTKAVANLLAGLTD